MPCAPPDYVANPAELSHVIDALATAVIILDSEFRVRHLNTAAEALLGISNTRACGNSSAQLLPGNEEFEAELEKVRTDATPTVRREMPLQLGLLDSRIVDCRVCLMNNAGRNELLVEMLDAEPRLKINREIALLAQQSVSRQLSRQLAHEIKNPLGGLRGAAQLLQHELQSDHLIEYTNVIVTEVDRLAALVDSMLGPHQPATRQATNVHKVLDHVFGLLQAEAPAGVTVIKDYDPSLPELQLDADLITQAALNLGRNALQVLQPGGRLCLRTRAETQYLLRGNRHTVVARLDFEDNGPGVASEVRDTLFYPLITARPGGTGLGLAVAQELINRHDGLIQLTQACDPTIFSIYLPATSPDKND